MSSVQQQHQQQQQPFLAFRVPLVGNMKFPDPAIHDQQHWWASIVGMVAGVTLFVTYYFISRCERKGPWKMPWYYFVVGLILSAFSGSSVACVLSTAVRSR